MPILTITVRGNELVGETRIKLERAYKFSKLKLQHIYHNIDAGHFTGKADKAGARLLFIKLNGMTDGGRNVINYSGDYTASITRALPTKYSNAEYQEGVGTLATGQSTSTTDKTTLRVSQDIAIDHLIPIGATHVSSKEITSRDLFKVIHEGAQPLQFNGEIRFELHYLNSNAVISPISSDTGGVQASESKGIPVSFMTMVFDYEEIPL